MRSTDYVTPFIDCLNNEKVSEQAHAISVEGLTHIVSSNLASDATASTIVDILNDKVVPIAFLSLQAQRRRHVVGAWNEHCGALPRAHPEHLLRDSRAQAAEHSLLRHACSLFRQRAVRSSVRLHARRGLSSSPQPSSSPLSTSK